MDGSGDVGPIVLYVWFAIAGMLLLIAKLRPPSSDMKVSNRGIAKSHTAAGRRAVADRSGGPQRSAESRTADVSRQLLFGPGAGGSGLGHVVLTATQLHHGRAAAG